MADTSHTQGFTPAAMRRAWNDVSADFLTRQGPFTGDIWYSPLAPPESSLQIIGSVTGLRILDFGCGGGQNAVALALHGATVTAVDISDANLDAAHRLVAAHGVRLELSWGDVSALDALPGATFDLILATMVLPYLPDVPRFLADCRRLLKPGARLIFSLDHPIRDCFFDPTEQEMDPFPARSYHDPQPPYFRFGATQARVPIARRTVADWIDLIAANLQLVRALEPATPPGVLDELWPEDSPLAPLRHLPHTIIFVAQASVD